MSFWIRNKEGKQNLTKLKKVWDLKNFVVILIALIMKILIIMIIIMILLIMMNIGNLEALEHYLKSLIVIITNQQEPMVFLQEEIIIT